MGNAFISKMAMIIFKEALGIHWSLSTSH